MREIPFLNEKIAREKIKNYLLAVTQQQYPKDQTNEINNLFSKLQALVVEVEDDSFVKENILEKLTQLESFHVNLINVSVEFPKVHYTKFRTHPGILTINEALKKLKMCSLNLQFTDPLSKVTSYFIEKKESLENPTFDSSSLEMDETDRKLLNENNSSIVTLVNVNDEFFIAQVARDYLNLKNMTIDEDKLKQVTEGKELCEKMKLSSETYLLELEQTETNNFSPQPYI